MLAKTFRVFSSRRQIEENARLLFEYLSLRSWDGGALRRGAAGRDAQPVYIGSLSGLLYSVKLEAMLGKALQLAGVRPVIVTRRRPWWTQRLFGAFGITDFVYLEDYAPTQDEVVKAGHFATSLIAGGATVPL